MRPSPGAALLAAVTTATLGAALLAPLAPASAEPDHPAPAPAPGADTRSLDKKVKVDRSTARLSTRARRGLRAQAAEDPVVGDSKIWPYLDYIPGTVGLQEYVLRGIGDHIQVWVAADTAFPDGDCRNDLGLAEITDAQVANFVSEFDANIYPKESKAFSVPPALVGENAQLPDLVDGMPADYYQGTPDEAGDTIVLVDNVKDENYFEPGTPDGQTYVAGFFTSTFNQLTDRNVMTIDAFDWKHRTGADVPDDTATAEYAACTEQLGLNRPLGAANPRLYEGTFAHEYQHLLESYESPGEASWVNEGLSDYAQTLVGYVDTRIPLDDDAADGHLACFGGYLGESFGGPENSLTRWQDQGGPEVLCDYGAAYSMMMYLRSKYGAAFLGDLHREDANGFEGLDAVLDAYGSKKSALQTVRDWAAMTAVDAALDNARGKGKKKGGKVTGVAKSDVTASWLSSSVNWRTPQAYDSPGAPSNGNDYVRFRSGEKKWLRASQLKSLTFKGATTLEPDPIEWTVDGTPPDTVPAGDATCDADVAPGTGAAALYSGCGTDLDRSIVHPVSVPAGDASLSFQTLYDIETAWDFAFVQVSEDGGESWTSLATEDTTTEADPEANPVAVENLPGLTGSSDGWVTQTADLSAYAGKDVLIAFRYVTDAAVDEAGFWVRDVTVGGTALPTGSLGGWESASQANPTEIPGWTVQLIGIRGNGDVWIHRVKVNAGFRASLDKKALRKALGTQAGVVAALVMVDDPEESLTKYGRYQLKVNNKLQPGG